jgi:uncharacterized repeat protein (TIGR01451 family)
LRQFLPHCDKVQMEVLVKRQRNAELQHELGLHRVTFLSRKSALLEIFDIAKTKAVSLRIRVLAEAALFGALGLLSSAIYAAGTPAGTPVGNSASVTYNFGAVPQPVAISNTAQFLVDRRINLTVAEVGGAATLVAPGASAQVLAYTVTNTSNAILDFRLSVSQDASTSSTAFGRTDNFDVTAPQVFVDANGNGIYEVGTDTSNFIDELPADTARTVFIVSTIPAGRVANDVAGLTLTAVAAQSTDGTGAYLPTPTVLAADAAPTNVGVNDLAAFTDTLFGDSMGDTDAARDGRHSDDDEYLVTQATPGFVKTQAVVGGGPPVPGATIEYTLTLNITGSGMLTGVRIDDLIPAGTTYVAGSLRLDSVALSDGADTDSGRFITTPLPGVQIEVVLGSVVAPVTHVVVFRVTIN